MKATYRPKIRNGNVTRRPVRGGHLGRAGWMPPSRRPQAVWALVVLGALIAGGFLTSLRWQLRALDTTRKAVQLKSALDQAESERRYLTVAEGGARNPMEIERAVNRNGALERAHLDDPSVMLMAQREAARASKEAAREALRASARPAGSSGAASGTALNPAKAKKVVPAVKSEQTKAPAALPLPAAPIAPVKLVVPSAPVSTSIQQ